jgi:translation elongation factor EF-1alpha
MQGLEPPAQTSACQDLRIPVFDVQQIYNNKHIFGKIESGFMFRGMTLTFYPSGYKTTVTSIHQSDEKIDFAGCGDFISFTVKNYSDMI